MSEIVTCTICKRKKRVLFNFDGEDICSDCVNQQIFFNALKDELQEDHNIRKVAMETGVFTQRNPFLQVYIAAMDLLHWYVERDFVKDGAVYLGHIEHDLRRYATDFRNDVLPVFKRGGIVKDIVKKTSPVDPSKEEDYVELGNTFYEVYGYYQQNPQLGLMILEGLISSLTIAELKQSSNIRKVFIEAISEHTSDTDGIIDGNLASNVVIGYRCTVCERQFSDQKDIEDHITEEHLTPPDQVNQYIKRIEQPIGYKVPLVLFEEKSRKYLMPRQRFVKYMNQCLKWGFVFDQDRPYVEIDGVTYLNVKPEWVKVLSKTKVYLRNYIREYERTLEKEKGF